MNSSRVLDVALRVCFLLTVLAILTPREAVSQDSISAETLKMAQELTPEQRRALLESAGTAGLPSNVPRSSESERVGSPRDRDVRRNRQETEPLSSALSAQDTIAVQLSFAPEEVVERPQANIEPRPLNATEVPPEQAATKLRRQRMAEALTAQQRRDMESLITLVHSRNPYVLDRNGQITLPGFPPIALGGLTEQQATQRLSFEPALLALEVYVVRLPLVRTGAAGLKPFGYDLFDNAPSTFSPVTDVPVPVDYVMGAGDELNVQMFGNQSRNLRLAVNREGVVTFPELGPIRVAGLTFTAAKQLIESSVAEQMIGARANVSMGETKSIRVFVLGEARLPGSYTVSGLATMTTALFASGGVTPIGSLRNVELKRQGTVVRRLDLYDMLISGDTSADARLQPGDVIFIPPVGPTISVDGEVRRPAIYELLGSSTVDDVVRIAGGLTPEADPARGSLTRIDSASRRVVVGVDLGLPSSRRERARNGDALHIARLRPQIDAGVVVTGFVHRQGPVAWREGLRLSDVIGSIDELKPNADPHYILVRRESGNDRRISVHSADLVAALAAPGGSADIILAPRDQITVFDLAPGRERIIQPLMDELRQQGRLDRPTELVRVGGSVRVPGEYPLEPGMRIADLLRAGGNLLSAAFTGDAELARDLVTDSGSRQTELIDVDLAGIRRGDTQANRLLQPSDYLVVKQTPDWADRESVTLKGEVRFPGTYPIRQGETLRQVIDRAGGMTSQAFPRGSAFTRKETREIEQKQLDQLEERLQASLASLALQAAAANQAGSGQALASAEPLLAQLRDSKAVGRLTIDMPGLLAAEPGSARDIELRDGDELVVPKQRLEVTIIGEVQGATSHIYSANLTRDDYISRSGGLTRKADRRQIYVVRAEGTVVSQKASIFRRSHDLAILPGDTIVVPLNTERMPRLPFWQAVTQIVYNLAVSVAAVNSF